jgi:hypothetical protein
VAIASVTEPQRLGGYMQKGQTQTIKKIISWAVGVPAFIIAFSEVNDLSYWWMPFVAMALLVLILKWNRLFDEPNDGGKVNAN